MVLLTDLQPNTLYWYQVMMKNGIGFGNFSKAANFSTLSLPPPSPSTNIKVLLSTLAGRLAICVLYYSCIHYNTHLYSVYVWFVRDSVHARAPELFQHFVRTKNKIFDLTFTRMVNVNFEVSILSIL